MMKCKDCVFFDQPQPLVYGQCRRSAPAPVFKSGPHDSFWPSVRDDDWCGEWRPKRPMSLKEAVAKINDELGG